MSTLYQSTEDGERVTADQLMRMSLEADAKHYSAEEIQGYTVAERMAAYCEAYGWELVPDAPAPKVHTCDAECWAHMLRHGQESAPACDPWTARAAADREAYAEGAIS